MLRTTLSLFLVLIALALFPAGTSSQTPPEFTGALDQSDFHFSNRKDGKVTIENLRIGVSGRYLVYVSIEIKNNGKYPITFLAISIDGLKVETGCPSENGPNIPWDCRMHLTMLSWGDKASYDLGMAVKDPPDEIRPGESRTLEFKAETDPLPLSPKPMVYGSPFSQQGTLQETATSRRRFPCR